MLLHTTEMLTLIAKIIRLTTLFKTCFRDYVPPVAFFAHQLEEIRPTNNAAIENMMLQMVAKNLCINIRSIAQELSIFQFEFRESLKAYIHINWHQHKNYFLVMSNITCFFCNWFIQGQIIRDVIYFKKALFTKQNIYKRRNKHFWSNENL